MERCLDESRRRAMAEAAGAPEGGWREVLRGPLWLAAAPGKLEERGDAAAGMEGLLTEALGTLCATPDGDERLESLGGHFVAALADEGRRKLTLWRDLSGGERLYWARAGDIVLFAASVRPLLASGLLPRAMDPQAGLEYVLNGGVLCGGRTLFAGIHELRPGERLRFAEGRQESRVLSLFAARGEGEEPTRPERLREALLESVRRSLGDDREAGVALSGGVDSSVIAALAAQAVGRENVRAFTYEFRGVEGASDVPYAARVCRHLGIRHEVLRISYRDYLEALPETVWRSEEAGTMRGNPALLMMARLLAPLGLRKMLTGAAMELTLRMVPARNARLGALARRAQGLRRPERALSYWKYHQFYGQGWLRGLERLGAGLGPPPRDLYFLILCLMRQDGVLRDVSGFYPAGLREAASTAVDAAGAREFSARLSGADLAGRIQEAAFHSCDFPRLLPRKAKLTREAGSIFLAPAFFPQVRARVSTAPAASKSPLRQAMRRDLPEDILHRPKAVDNMIVPDRWFADALRALSPLLETSGLRDCFPRSFDPMRRHCLSGLTRLALWHRLLIERPPGAGAPSWAEVLG